MTVLPPLFPSKMGSPRFFSNRNLWFWLLLLFIILMFGLIRLGLFFEHPFYSDTSPFVSVKPVQVKDVPQYISALGTVDSDVSVVVRTKVNGTLLRVLFNEGQMVKAGDLLAQMDPTLFQAQLLQYQGQYERDVALLENAKIDVERYQKLWKKNSIAEQTFATQQSLVKQLEGAVKMDEGLIATAKINLSYCDIKAPVAGKIGLSLVDEGNYLKTTDANGIATINSLDPISVLFSIPADDLSVIKNEIGPNKSYMVKAYNRDQTILLNVGKLSAVDNQIDPTTGTIKLRAEFSNSSTQLFPNQFVNIQLLVNTLHHALVIPASALVYEDQGKFVYVLNSNNTVSKKKVVVETMLGEDAVIKSGIEVKQMVVTDGTNHLTDGLKVKFNKI